MDYEKKIAEVTANIYKKEDEKAQYDLTRPKYHFHAPSQWMDDPNGVIYYKGYYHMMYSLNPDTDKYRAGMVYKTGSSNWTTSDPDWTGGITVWGHARSKDLVHWEHMPVALYPDTENDEYYIWFGCTAINDEGIPVAIYTSIGYEDRNPTSSAIQHIWTGDDDLITWKPVKEANPIMTEKLHGGHKIWEWRDPFMFRQNGKAYLILGGKQDASDGGKAVVLLYEPTNPAFTEWKYKGILFEFPDPELRSCECPNIVNIDGKWVMLISPHGPVQYFVGDLDAENCKFDWQTCGYVDRSTHFYATNVVTDEKKRRLMWGAIEGFSNPSGWNGINSLPREISLTSNGKLRQKVVDEIIELRAGEAISVKDSCEIQRGTLEMEVNLEAGAEGCISVGENIITVKNGSIEIEGKVIEIPENEEHRIKAYIDISAAEIFIDEEEVFSAILTPVTGKSVVSKKGNGISVLIYELDAENLYSRYKA